MDVFMKEHLNSVEEFASTSTDGQSQQQGLRIPPIFIVQQAVAASGTSTVSTKRKSDNDYTPNTTKKRTSLEDRCKYLKNELKESKGTNLKMKKTLNNQLKEKQAEVNQLRKENGNLKKELAALSKEHPAKKEVEKLQKKYKYLFDEHEKLRQTRF